MQGVPGRLEARGNGAEVLFIESRRSWVAKLATNSPLSLAKATESFQPSLENPTIGDTLEKLLKKL